MTGLHKDLGADERHPTVKWIYADETARLAATGFTAVNVGGEAWQQSDDTFWTLKNHSPITWIYKGGAGGTPAAHAASHVTTDPIQDATSSQKGLATATQIGQLEGLISGAQKIDLISMNTSPAGVPDSEGVLSWNSAYRTVDINSGWGPVNQAGYEDWILVYNATGVQIDNGSPVYPVGQFMGVASVALANATDHTKIATGVAVTTMDIPDSTFGIATSRGDVRGFDTSHLVAGAPVYVGLADGSMTATRPTFPNYVILLGGCTVSDAVNGEINIQAVGEYTDTFNNFHNGTIREKFNFTISSNGTIITGSLSPAGSQEDLTMMFSDGFALLDTTPAKTVTLTAGTDTNPQINYVYIPKSTKVLTVSTSGWPSEEYIYIAKVLCQSATKTQSDGGAFKNQNINNEVMANGTLDEGFLKIIGETIRNGIGAQWVSGTQGASTVDVNVGVPDDVWVTVTGGVVRQMHDQTFPSFDLETGDVVHVTNDNTTPFATTGNLNTELTDAQGNSMSGNTFSFVLWGVANKSGEVCHLMLNLPTNSYGSPTEAAINDSLGYSVYSVPAEFKGVGFLIARFTYSHSPSNGGTWTLEDTEDLRGFIPNVSAGGSAGGTGVTTWLALTDTPSSYSGQAYKIPRVTAGEAALEFRDFAHAASHTDGSDDIQDATASQKGLMTAAYATKLDGIEAGAQVNTQLHSDLTDVSEDQHHNRQHGLGSTSDHSSATLAQVNALISDATLGDAADAAPEDVTKAAAAVGTSPDFAREDHKHNVSTAIAGASTPGDSSAEGTATSLARSDHQHGLPAFGSISGTFCEGNDSRLSDARPPTAHASSHTDGTDDIQSATSSQKGLATATQITKLDGIESGADVTDATNVAAAGAIMKTLADAKGDLLVATAADIIARLAIGTNGTVLTADSAESSGMKWATGSSYPQFQFFADQLDVPNNSDWAVNSAASSASDTNNAGLTVRLFDDSTVEGVGAIFEIPTGATNIKIKLRSRAETASTFFRNVLPKIYVREIPDNGVVESWSAGTDMTVIVMGSGNEYFQYDVQTIALSTLGLVAGRICQLELVRGSTGTNSLVGDWVLLMLGIEFT